MIPTAKHNSSRVLLVVFSVCGFLSSADIRAQVESGKIVGTVRDPSGAMVADALVTVTETNTHTLRKVTTGTAGDYVVTELQPGNYEVTAEHEGFKRVEQAAFKLDVNQAVRADLQLSVGSVQELVVVTAAQPLIESETSSLGQVIEQSRVNDLPLNGRNFIQLAYLAPGVNAGPQGAVQQGGIPENERGNGAIQVNGLTATNNNFLLNGFDNNEQQIGFEIIQPAVDAIEEFKVQTNNFGADIGKGGAVVNVVLKSGSNALHGGLYEFLRNSALDAKNYFDDRSAPIVPFKQNQFGGTLGGPIRRDKTFFFVDYQGTRIRQSQTDISFIPQVAERHGNFADLCAAGFDPSGICLDRDPQGNVIDQIYNPCQPGTGVMGIPCMGNSGLRAPFPNNQIPTNALDPAAQNVLGLFPAAANVSGTTNQFRYNPVAKNDQNSFDIRIDHQLASKDSLFGFFSFGDVNSAHPDPLPGQAGGGTFSGIIKNKSRAIGVSEVHTFSATKVNEFKLGYTRYVVNAVPNFAGQPVSQNLGIPGINDPTNLLATGGLTNINISGIAALGNICCFPEFLKENNYQVLDAVTYIRGHHIVKAGGDLKLRRHGFFQALNPTGVMNFDQQFTADLSNQSGHTGNALATFELGFPIFAARDLQRRSYGMSWWEVSGYLMDDYRVARNLTLNLGVRYDVYTPMVEDHNLLANFDFATGLFISPQQRGVSRSGNVLTDRNNVAPRLGFAYTPWVDNKTVLRGGMEFFTICRLTRTIPS
ncbi:MAG: carboxypeptidase-like regulatory domain-containing protein [Acidobacteriota bacterium]|nr:carboxypeptidase-like regulatory domain-containing protein [Acidobacteriota bacterium]